MRAPQSFRNLPLTKRVNLNKTVLARVSIPTTQAHASTIYLKAIRRVKATFRRRVDEVPSLRDPVPPAVIIPAPESSLEADQPPVCACEMNVTFTFYPMGSQRGNSLIRCGCGYRFAVKNHSGFWSGLCAGTLHKT